MPPPKTRSVASGGGKAYLTRAISFSRARWRRRWRWTPRSWLSPPASSLGPGRGGTRKVLRRKKKKKIWRWKKPTSGTSKHRPQRRVEARGTTSSCAITVWNKFSLSVSRARVYTTQGVRGARQTTAEVLHISYRIEFFKRKNKSRFSAVYFSPSCQLFFFFFPTFKRAFFLQSLSPEERHQSSARKYCIA